MNCPRCKAEVTELQVFCHSCGADLAEPAKPPPKKATTPPAPARPAAPAPRQAPAPPAPPRATPTQPTPPLGPQAPTQQIQPPAAAQQPQPGPYAQPAAGQPWAPPTPRRAGAAPGVIIAAVAGVVVVILAICLGFGFFAVRSFQRQMQSAQAALNQQTTNQGGKNTTGGSGGTTAAKPGEEAAVAAALSGNPGWVAQVTDHASDWTTATVIIGPPQSEFVGEIALAWNSSTSTYETTSTRELPPPDGGSNGSNTTSVFVFDNSDTDLIDPAILEKVPDKILCIARNEIYARHGLTFQSPPLNDWFSAQEWYTGTTSNPDAIKLNSVEAENIGRILAKEKARNSLYVKTPFQSW